MSTSSAIKQRLHRKRLMAAKSASNRSVTSPSKSLEIPEITPKSVVSSTAASKSLFAHGRPPTAAGRHAAALSLKTSLDAIKKDQQSSKSSAGLSVKTSLDSTKRNQQSTKSSSLSVKTKLDSTRAAPPLSKSSSVATTANSRSLFRKSTPNGSELTLAKKLSFRRRSRLHGPMIDTEDSNDEEESSTSKTTSPSGLSTFQSIFAKISPKESNTKKPDKDSPTEKKDAADRVNQILATKRMQRRNNLTVNAKAEREAALMKEQQQLILSPKEKSDVQNLFGSRSDQSKDYSKEQKEEKKQSPKAATKKKHDFQDEKQKAANRVNEILANRRLGEQKQLTSRGIGQRLTGAKPFEHGATEPATNNVKKELPGKHHEQESSTSQVDMKQKQSSEGDSTSQVDMKQTQSSEGVANNTARILTDRTLSGQNRDASKNEIGKQQQQPSVASPPPESGDGNSSTPNNRENVPLNDQAIVCEPRQMWATQTVQSDDEIEDLFVEMAFFARLGYIQPPSCLRCVYQASIEKKTPDTNHCNRWVPWRKNANIILHPNRLVDNIVMIRCHAACSLVEGQEIQGYKWDKNRRQLVSQ